MLRAEPARHRGDPLGGGGSAQTILDAGVRPWRELPLWLAGDEYAGLLRADIDRALAAGLTFRPLAETARDTFAWDRTVEGDRKTLGREKEQEILARG